LLEPAAISVPSESSPESSACGSALPDAHAHAESPERLDSCRSCDAENALLPWLLSVPCRLESAPAPHALRFLHAVAQVVVMVEEVLMVMVVAHCGRGGVAGG